MADKRISDFPLLDEVSEDDYVLVSSNSNTYKAKASAFGEFSGGKGGYFKKVFSGTLTEATKSFKFTTFADGTPLRFTELLIRGAATTNLAAGNIQNLNVYYGWEGDGKYNAYKGIGNIENFCRPGGTDISSSEYSLRSELLGTKIYNQYGFATSGGVSKTELKTSETDLYTQLAFWSGNAGVCQAGSWFEVYAR